MSYITLEAFLKKKGQGLFWELLKKLSQEDQIVELKKFILDTASLHNDEVAAFLWEALLHAVSDQMLAPLMKEVKEYRGPEIRIRSACPIDPEATAIHKKHREFCAALAQEIFAAVPAFKEIKEWDEDQRKDSLVKHLTLLETKKLLWSEIAGWWRDTENDQTAIEMLDWLLALEVKFTEERDALREIMRDQVGSMNERRLLAGMMRIKQYLDNNRGIGEGEQRKRLCCNDTDEWLKLMLHAWIRRQKAKNAVDQLAALAPIAAHGPMAWELLRNYAELMGAFCQQVQELCDLINSPNCHNSIFEHGVAELHYETLGEVIIDLSVPCSGYKETQESVDARLIVAMVEKIGAWAKERSGIRIFARIGHRPAFSSQGFIVRHEFWVN